MSKSENCCFDGKVVLVTGASSGIGATTAVNFAKLGASLAITGRNLQNLKKTADECEAFGKKPYVIQADLMKEDDVTKVVNLTIQHFGKLNVLINNAGIFELGGLLNTSLDTFDRTFNTNVRAVFQLTSLAMPYLIKSKGNIINVSSVASMRAFTTVAAYCMSKASLDHFTRCIAMEFASKQVRVNSVNPGLIVTELQNKTGLAPEQVNQFIEHQKNLHPLGRVGQPQEVAETIVFLASDKCQFITGVSLPVDGGYHSALPK